MRQDITPSKLNPGDNVRIISPSRSLAMGWITEDIIKDAKDRFSQLGLEVSFSKNAYEIDEYDSSPITSRTDDIHDAFLDSSIKMVITTIGGYNSNQLLPYLDYDLIAANPKILCGYSDITALANAIYSKTGLVTYSGPHFFNFGEHMNFDYTLDYFRRIFFQKDQLPIEILPSEKWSNDLWGKDQENRKFIVNEGHWVLQSGKQRGRIIGGNLSTLHLLSDTPYMPPLEDSILFIEDDSELSASLFERIFVALSQQLEFASIKGLVIGRFQPESGVSRKFLSDMIARIPSLKDLPIIANVDFGHTTPMITYPIGGEAELSLDRDKGRISIVRY